MRAKDEAKEQLILNTALSMIARVGLSGLKMTDLACESGLATGTVYIYFVDKNALIQKLYIFLTKENTIGLISDISEKDPTKVKIQKLSFNYLKKNLEYPEYSAFFEQYYRSPYFLDNPEIASEENALMQPIFEMVLRGQQEQIIKNINAELLVTLVCGMLNELAKQASYEKRLVSDEEWKATFTVIWDGIKS
jgi:TetR/AcrR family transcriptional regulator, multidrug resistance operon repressor